jgi:hypothetical protein
MILTLLYGLLSNDKFIENKHLNLQPPSTFNFHHNYVSAPKP